MKIFKALFLVSGILVVSAEFSLWSSLKSMLGFGARVDQLESPAPAEPARLTAADISGVINEAKLFIASQDFDKAIKMLLPLIDNDPDDKEANMLLGSSFLAMNRADLAETFLHHAVQLTNWSEVEPISALAAAIRMNGDLSLSGKVLQKGYATLNSTDRTGRLSFGFGELQEQLGNFSVAADWYLSAALADKSNSVAWLKASTLLFPSENWNLDLAESVLASAVKANPSQPSLYFNLGVVMHYTNRLKEAVTFYGEALRLDDTNYAAMSNMATALHGMNLVTDALVLYQRVYDATISLAPGEIYVPFSGTATALGNFALLLASEYRLEQAMAVVSRALQIEPENRDLISVQERVKTASAAVRADTDRVLGLLVPAVTSGQWGGALEILAANGPPVEDDAWWYFTKGMLHYFRGENKEALDHCSYAHQRSVSYAQSSWLRNTDGMSLRVSHLINGCLGVANQYLGNHAAAANNFKEALETLNLMSPSLEAPAVRVHVLPNVGFAMTAQDVTFNLLSALKHIGEYEQCMNVGLRSIGVNADLTDGAGTIVLLSFVGWTGSESLLTALATLEKAERASGRFNLPEGTSLLSEIQRIQNFHIAVLTPISECFDLLAAANKRVETWRDHATTLIMQAVNKAPKPISSSPNGAQLVLITQYFHAQDPAIRDDLVEVLSRNLRNPDIAEIALINEREYDFSALEYSEKIKQYVSGRRLTFSDAFRVANTYYPGRVVVVSNSDIFFDESIKLVDAAVFGLNKSVLALSKWTASMEPASADGEQLKERKSLSLRVDSQDAWIFKSPVPDSVVENTEFFLGAPRCDNRIAKIISDVGYRVVNPAFSVHAIEKTTTSLVRTALQYGVEKEVRGPIAHVLLSDSSVL